MLDFHLSYQPPSSIDPLPSPASCICPAWVASRFSVGMVCSKFLSFLSLATGKPGPSCGRCSYGIEPPPRAAFHTRILQPRTLLRPLWFLEYHFFDNIFLSVGLRTSPNISGCLHRLYEFCFLLYVGSCGLSVAYTAEVSKPH